ncbi:hypothetical protein LY76DRAFT_567224 [Colletotrichum caudatum]|nr:hypothetical protein LY76DRAFT_567224 [Colletotrichum caudatum]
MSFSLFPCTRQAPQQVLTDHVTTVGYFDDTLVFTTFVMSTMFVFPAQLDAEKLHDALKRVVCRPGWNKLTARLRRNDKGPLEHHIPQSFSEDRRPITFDHVNHCDMLIKEHPAGSRIPRPPSDGNPAVVGNPDDFLKLVDGPKIPEGLNDYLYSDRSELGLCIVSFKDSTVVVLHWIHLAFDAMTLGFLLEAWRLALEGKDDQIAEPFPLDTYPLEDLGKSPQESHVLADRRMSVSGIAFWVLRNIYRLVFRRKEHRMVCVPHEFLKKLREDALEELKELDDGTTAKIPKEEPFLSDGDVLIAWFTRLSLSNFPDSKRLVAVQQAYDWRRVLEDLLPSNKPFLCNCVGFLVTLMPVSDILKKPLSHLALAIRRSIIEQRTRKQVEAYSSFVRQDLRTKSPPLFGCPSMWLLMFSNWKKANMHGVNLSGAAVHPRNEPLFPSYVQTVQGPYNFTDGIIILGKDQEDNYWLSGYKPQGEWDALERQMKGDSRGQRAWVTQLAQTGLSLVLRRFTSSCFRGFPWAIGSLLLVSSLRWRQTFAVGCGK